MKPKIVIEQKYNSSCMHLMVRLDNKKQIKYLLKFLFKFVFNKENQSILKSDINDIFKFDKTTFSSNRIVDKKVKINYLTIDEGKKEKKAFIYFTIDYEKKNSKIINDYQVEDYFQPW